MKTGLRGVLLLMAACASAGAAQIHGVAALREDPRVREALAAARASEPAVIEEQIRLCEIPAPPFQEMLRARAVADALRRAGLANVRTDRTGNVLGERPGRRGSPHLVLSAHLDTVFPEGADVRVTREGSVLRGPGIGDNCRGLAVLLAVARALASARVETAGPITFAATVGEEGLGNLRGVRALIDQTLERRVDRFVSIDGPGDAIYHVGVGSRRYRVTFTARGGHSYDDFGAPNPVHALGRAVAFLAAMSLPERPKTTFNVGRIGGGTSVNAIPAEAWMELDLRSSDPSVLRELDARVHAAIRRAVAEENKRGVGSATMEVRLDLVGHRPAGRTDADASIVRTALAVARVLSQPAVLVDGSTDANYPMSLGIPAITVGAGGRGTGAHTVEETFDTTGSSRGTERLVLLTIALANEK